MERAATWRPIALAIAVLVAAVVQRPAVPHVRVAAVVDGLDADAAAERQRLAHRATVTDWFAEYRDGNEIDAYLDGLVARHPGVARVHVLGASVEGRPIRALELSRGGFVLPPEQIAPTCDESLAGVLALAEWVIGHPR